MGLYYFDASALVKYYILEPGSTWVRNLIDAVVPDQTTRLHIAVISEASIVEAPAAFAVLYRTQRIRQRARLKAMTDFNTHVTTSSPRT